MVSTALSLIFVPAVFTLLDDVGGLTWRLFARMINPSEDRAQSLTERMAGTAAPVH